MYLIGSLYKDMVPIGIMGTTGSEVAVVAVTTDTTTVGAIIDLQGFSRALFVLLNKTLTDGDYEFQLFHDTESDMSTEAQVAATDLNGTLPDWDADTDDDQVETVEYIARKRYVRIKIVSTSTTTGVDAIGGVCLKAQPGKAPQQT